MSEEGPGASDTGPVERQPHNPTYQVPGNIAWVDGADFGMAEELYLTVVPDGQTVLLKGTARMIWIVASEGGSVVDEVAQLVARPPAEIEDQVGTFLADLTNRGLLAERQVRWPSITMPPGLD
ncbi:hypothetical protein GCM10023168_24060 [Fodinibacter luteus]|uniref:PqqD family protein n=1 Tax=Fodinibacter luteus TaxID=552064 RepID=A0ABP8KJ36_9MICO